MARTKGLTIAIAQAFSLCPNGHRRTSQPWPPIPSSLISRSATRPPAAPITPITPLPPIEPPISAIRRPPPRPTSESPQSRIGRRRFRKTRNGDWLRAKPRQPRNNAVRRGACPHFFRKRWSNGLSHAPRVAGTVNLCSTASRFPARIGVSLPTRLISVNGCGNAKQQVMAGELARRIGMRNLAALMMGHPLGAIREVRVRY